MKLFTQSKRFAAILLTAALLFSSSACKPADESVSPSSSSSQTTVETPAANLPAFINPLPHLETTRLVPQPPTVELLAKISDKTAINSDVVGWLRVPGTPIDEQVLQGPGPDDGYDVRKLDEYYVRRNLYKSYDFYGSYFTDYENMLGDRNNLSKNTIIYGHSMTDNLERDKDTNKTKFTEIKRYNDPAFAAANPYVFFSTPEDDMVWQVFAALYTDIDLPYFYPDYTTEKFNALTDQMLARSEVDFGVDVNANDKILVLSTCTYKYGLTEQEHKNFRYLVCARLVRPDEEIKASNPAAKANADVIRPDAPLAKPS